MKSAKEIAKEISQLMYDRARLNKKMRDESYTYSSLGDEYVEDGDEINPTLILSKSEILNTSERKRLKVGFLGQLKTELGLLGVKASVDASNETIMCKSTFYKENPNEFNSLESLKKSIKDDEDFYSSE